VTLVATGFMTSFALQAASELGKEGTQVDLLHYPSVKPFDSASLIKSAIKTGRVVTVENQNIIGGLGGAVCEAVCAEYPVAVKRLGIPDRFGEVADQEYLFRKHGLGPHDIAQRCREIIRKKS
jgi:transketolase